MDIQYLLFLQDFRNGIDNALTPFMEWVSLFGITYIMLLPVFVYWCLDKRKGLLIFSALKISHTLNSIVKLTACVYRPWIRDARIIPAGDAIRTATGYSFPSGHTMMATPIYGGLALCSQKKYIKLFWILAILVTGFSRNYLGVHTPQDVLVGLLLGTISIYIANWVLNYIENSDKKFFAVMLICALAGALTLVYVTYKNYPMDYVDGKLLVDPVKMTRDAWGDAGGFIAFALMWCIEKKYIKFSSTGFNLKGILINLIGMLPLIWMIGNLEDITTDIFGSHHGRLAYQFIFYFYIMVIWPLVIKILTGNKNNKNKV